MEPLLGFASHKRSIFSCSAITRLLHFPSSAHRLQPTQATFSPPTTHPACVSILAPLHSNFPQMGTELWGRALRIPCTCVSHTTAQGAQDQGWSWGTRGWGMCRGDGDIIRHIWAGSAKEGQQQTNESTYRLCCIVWLRLPGYLYVSLLQRRKPLLLDPDVSGRTDGSPTERWQPGPAEGLLLHCYHVLSS